MLWRTRRRAAHWTPGWLRAVWPLRVRLASAISALRGGRFGWLKCVLHTDEREDRIHVHPCVILRTPLAGAQPGLACALLTAADCQLCGVCTTSLEVS